jgi:hypothetical protein
MKMTTDTLLKLLWDLIVRYGWPPKDLSFLAGPQGDAINAVLAAAGYKLRRLLNWMRLHLNVIANLMLIRSRAVVRLQIT